MNGWTMTGFHRIQSGGPLVFTMGTDVAQNGILQPNGQYALLVPGRRPMMSGGITRTATT